MKVVAIGIVAATVSLAVFATLDVWVLISGHKTLLSHSISGVWYLSLATLAALFSAFTVFIWRPLVPRVAVALFSAAIASQVLDQFVTLPAQCLRVIAGCRICVSTGVFLLFLRYRWSTLRTVKNLP